MPFELGLAVALALAEDGPDAHQFRILEAKPYRLQQSLSDVLGHDPYIHRGSSDGVLEKLLDVFAHLPDPPDIIDMRRLCRDLRKFRNEKLGVDIFTPRAFSYLIVASRKLAEA
jgi:hypothetical protein